jgi:transcriptional regulator with XRE-family HTH domain
MVGADSSQAARLIRRLRRAAGITQSELAERAGTTQSVISRLERDDYDGHSLSMLYRIGAALNRRIVVVEAEQAAPVVREAPAPYGAAAAGETPALSEAQIDALAARIAQRFADRGITEADVREAIRWTRGDDEGVRAAERLAGSIEIGPGDVAEDVRRARAQRGRPVERAH